MALKRFKVSYIGDDLKKEIGIKQSMDLLSFKMYCLNKEFNGKIHEYIILDLTNNYLLENKISRSRDYMAWSNAIIMNGSQKEINFAKALDDFCKVSKDGALKLMVNNESSGMDGLIAVKSVKDAFDYLDNNLD